MWEDGRIVKGVVGLWSVRENMADRECLKPALHVLGNAAALPSNCDRLWAYKGVQEMLKRVLNSALKARVKSDRAAAVDVMWIYANLAEGAPSVRRALRDRCAFSFYC